MYEIFKSWALISKKLHKHKTQLFLFDFDGTLSPIVGKPEWARIPKSTKRRLENLSRIKGAVVGIISGRSLKDVKTKVGIPGFIYSGNHGLELRGTKLHFEHPKNAHYRKKVVKILKTIKEALSGCSGVIIENKGLTASIHYRRANSVNQRKIRKVISHCLSMIRLNGFIVRDGKKVFEIRPAVNWNKGAIVSWLSKKYPKSLVFYIGDDTTDEDAFRVLIKNGIGLRVGISENSKAAYYLRNQTDVSRFIDKLINELKLN